MMFCDVMLYVLASETVCHGADVSWRNVWLATDGADVSIRARNGRRGRVICKLRVATETALELLAEVRDDTEQLMLPKPNLGNLLVLNLV